MDKIVKRRVSKANGGGGNSLPHLTTAEKRLCITMPEAAAMLGISRNFAYELVKRKELPVIKFGKRLLIPRIALETILSQSIKQGD